jgi:hypothetical protein
LVGIRIALVAGLWFLAGGAAAGVLLGAHVGIASDPNWQAKFVALEAQIGRNLAIDSDYDDWATFPDSPRIKWDMQNGILPMQSWSILFQSNNVNACATAVAISSGVYDTQLAQQAAAAKALGGVILVRWNWEMADNSFNQCFTGFPVKQNIALAGQEYITAWRHMVDRFRAAGANNVKWIWAPGATTFYQNLWAYFYPGAGYVDWIGVDGYNQTLTPSPFGNHNGFASFDAAVTPLGKPMMFSENAAFNDPTQNPDPQTVWIDTARDWIKQHPEISAYVYWDSASSVLPPPPYSGSGYYLGGPGLAAFTALANDPYFGGSGQ